MIIYKINICVGLIFFLLTGCGIGLPDTALEIIDGGFRPNELIYYFSDNLDKKYSTKIDEKNYNLLLRLIHIEKNKFSIFKSPSSISTAPALLSIRFFDKNNDEHLFIIAKDWLGSSGVDYFNESAHDLYQIPEKEVLEIIDKLRLNSEVNLGDLMQPSNLR